MTRPVLAGLLLAVCLTAPAAADWLVTADGARIQTRGPWRIEGRTLLFDLPDGTLASVRLSEIDLEASTRATAEALAASLAPPPAAPVPGPAVLVLTDRDVGHVTPEALSVPAPPAEGMEGAEAVEGVEAAEGAEAAEPAEPAEPLGGDGTQEGATGETGAARPAGVEVGGWRQFTTSDEQGMEVFGALLNTSKRTSGPLAVVVEVRDEEGALLTSERVEPVARILPPGGRTNFRARFPGLTSAPQVTFQVEQSSATDDRP